jgi:hypothetical protein
VTADSNEVLPLAELMIVSVVVGICVARDTYMSSIISMAGEII